MGEEKKEYMCPEIEFVEFEIEDSISGESSSGSVFFEDIWG